MTNLTTCVLSVAVLLLTFAGTADAQPFVLDDEYAADTEEVESGFMLRVGEDVVPYSVMAAFVMPGETLPLDVLLPTGENHRSSRDSTPSWWRIP
ncbi:MAG: hypothetical protein GVY25_06485 [Bacteroidetes bacterium]|jgi:hypothetical protein|nr:hypothetical protein [Bacteroidota bacterium]